jgi:hypothetical protein
MQNDREQIIFITPENLQIIIPICDLYEVCKQYCISYIDKSEGNRETFEKFASQYTYFDPYYDFLICVLKWISYPSLLDKKSYVQKGSNENKKVLRELIESDQLDYDKLYLEGSYIREVYNSNDKNIGVNLSKLIAQDGFIDGSGIHMSTRTTYSHELTSAAILYGICFENSNVLVDVWIKLKNGCVLERDSNTAFSDYLVQRLGYLSITTNRGYDRIEYSSSLLTHTQRKAISGYEEMGFFSEQNSNCNFDIYESKALTAYYRSCRLKGRGKV